MTSSRYIAQAVHRPCSFFLEVSHVSFCKSSITLRYFNMWVCHLASAWLCFHSFLYIYMKTWSQSCHSFHAVKALASPKLSKRATPKAPRLCTYIESTLDNERQNRSKPIRAVYNTPHEAFPLLCS